VVRECAVLHTLFSGRTGGERCLVFIGDLIAASGERGIRKGEEEPPDPVRQRPGWEPGRKVATYLPLAVDAINP